MMNTFIFGRGWKFVGAVVAGSLFTAPTLAAQMSPQDSAALRHARPAARAEIARANRLLAAHDTTGALKALRHAIQADPNAIAAHDQFIDLTNDKIIDRDDDHYASTMALARDSLVRDYQRWARHFPTSAGIQYGLGAAYSSAEDPRAKPYLLRAVAMDSTIASAYEMLSIDADRWGNADEAREFMRKASEADPTNPSYAFYYADAVRDVDTAEYRRLALDVARRFPKSERGAQSLYWLAVNTPTDAGKIAVLRELQAKYPPGTSNWASSGMMSLFDVYLAAMPDSALSFAREMRASAHPSDTASWRNSEQLAQSLVQARALLAAGKDAEALAVLQPIHVSSYWVGAEVVALMKARAAAGSGHVQAAYDSLVARFARAPEDSVGAAIRQYGATLGKTPAQVDADVWRLRDAKATDAAPFSLKAYLGDSTISLADYKGKVVLLTFWFPGCGPCRGEFPHFEQVIRQFKGRDVAYVGINVEPEQDAYVIPFMTGTKYSFTPLHGTSQFAAASYHVRGEPTNFLIDQQGRIMYKNFMIHDEQNERMLTLMIQSLLDRGSTASRAEGKGAGQ
jgi:thiol-disulfide isomerase/thioredoxin/Tfp pilus assembly protein PilF